MKCRRPGAQRPAGHRGRDRPGERGREAGHVDRRGRRGPPGGHGDDREGIAERDRPALRRRHALPGRPVPPVPLQEVHRRAAGLRPGAGHRLLRRRPGQLRVSRATTSTSASSASTRTASPPRSSTTSKWSDAGAEGRTSWSSSPATRAGPTGSTRWPSWSSCATSRYPLMLRPAPPARGAAARRTASAARRTPGGRRTTCSASQNSRKALIGGLAGLQDPAILDAEADRRADSCGAPSSGDDGARRRSTATPGTRSPRPQKARGRDCCDDYNLLRSAAPAFNSELFSIARTLVRLAEEKAKPNAERLREYRESNLESLKQRLFSGADLRRPREREAGRLARACSSRSWAPTTRWCRRCSPASRPRERRRRAGRRARSWPTSPCARSSPKAGRRRSTTPTTR